MQLWQQLVNLLHSFLYRRIQTCKTGGSRPAKLEPADSQSCRHALELFEKQSGDANM